MRRWKDLPCSWNNRINTVEMFILPKAVYTCNTVPSKFQCTSLQKLPKIILIFILKHKTLKIAKTAPNSKRTSRASPDFTS